MEIKLPRIIYPRHWNPGRFALAGLLAFGAACSDTPAGTPDSPVTPTPTPLPLTAEATILENNGLIARIVGEAPLLGDVFVEYWRQGGPRYRSRPVPSDGTDFTVYACRRPAIMSG